MLNVRTDGELREWPGSESVADRGGAMADKSERLSVRLNEVDRLLIESAAAAAGVTMTEFLLQSAREKAESQIPEEELLVLPSEDFDWLLDLVEGEPKPNPEFARSLAKVREMWGGLPWEQ